MNNTVDEEVKKAVAHEEEKHEKDRDFYDMLDRYMKIKDLDVLQSRKQRVPPLDTVGRRMHRSFSQK